MLVKISCFTQSGNSRIKQIPQRANVLELVSTQLTQKTEYFKVLLSPALSLLQFPACAFGGGGKNPTVTFSMNPSNSFHVFLL